MISKALVESVCADLGILQGKAPKDELELELGRERERERAPYTRRILQRLPAPPERPAADVRPPARIPNRKQEETS